MLHLHFIKIDPKTDQSFGQLKKGKIIILIFAYILGD